MESPGGVTTVPARRVGVIHEEMVAQRRAGVKVKGYGLTLSSWGKTASSISRKSSRASATMSRRWHLSQRQAYTLDPRSAGWACRYYTGLTL